MIYVCVHKYVYRNISCLIDVQRASQFGRENILWSRPCCKTNFWLPQSVQWLYFAGDSSATFWSHRKHCPDMFGKRTQEVDASWPHGMLPCTICRSPPGHPTSGVPFDLSSQKSLPWQRRKNLFEFYEYSCSKPWQILSQATPHTPERPRLRTSSGRSVPASVSKVCQWSLGLGCIFEGQSWLFLISWFFPNILAIQP